MGSGRYEYDLGIIGGGAAGLTVAAGAAQLGAKTLLIEKEGRLGGDCLHYGCVPSKTLIQTARVRHLMTRAGDFGLPGAGPGPVDFARVAARIRAVIEKIQHHDSVERFCGLGARVEFGRPVFRDERAVELNGNTVTARYWAVCTGSSPAIPPIPGLTLVGVLTNETLFSIQTLPESLLILGAGPIAVEMAQSFQRLGSRVTVVQRSGRILTREDADAAQALQAVLESEGVTFHLNAVVKEVGLANGYKEARIEDGNGRTFRVRAREILAALGRTPNTVGLGLESLGVETRKGIAVDARLRTARKNIFAAGDVTGRYPFTHAAGYEGGLVVANAVFRLPRKADYTWMPRCTYTEPELAVVGLTETEAREKGIDPSVWIEKFEDNDRALAEGRAEGWVKLVLDPGEKPVGVQILGPHAGELINEWVAALNGRVKLSTLAGAVHPYPTLGEINKRVAGRVLSAKLFSEPVKKGLRFFFNLKGRACEPGDL